MEYVTVGSGWDSIKKKPIPSQDELDSLRDVSREFQEIAQSLSEQYNRCIEKTVIRVFYGLGYTLNTMWECLCSQEWVDANNRGIDTTFDTVIGFVDIVIDETDNFGFHRCCQAPKWTKPIRVADKTDLAYYDALKALWAEVETEVS